MTELAGKNNVVTNAKNGDGCATMFHILAMGGGKNRSPFCGEYRDIVSPQNKILIENAGEIPAFFAYIKRFRSRFNFNFEEL
jgi:hypothetical protein